MAMACNTCQFNGYYSCLHCLNKCGHISRKHVLKPNDKHTPRTRSSFKKHVRDARSNSKPVYGIKGKSVLSNTLKQCPIDYMHCV